MLSLDDTIAAIATPLGNGGVGIIKLSGPGALKIAQQIFKPKRGDLMLKPRYLHYGQIMRPASGELIDEALIAYMPAPHSYTAQDVVEIQAHGGTVALQEILQLTLSLGARSAEAGEMTMRAFINGRLDLTQAEAVLDVIEARTAASLRVATQQLGGSLSKKVSAARQQLVAILAYLEATIDFVEEDILLENIIPPLKGAVGEIETLAASAARGLIYRQGIQTAIVGKPNVGKSSLLNALLRGERAIVTHIPGTTRDTLEETANIGGVPLILVDTAGIRAQTDDAVEQIGIERSRAALSRADLALMVVDSSQPLTQGDWEIEKLLRQKPALLVLNKIDLPQAHPTPDDFLPGIPQIPMSALTGEGLETLEKIIIEQVTGGKVIASDVALVSNPRHQALINRAIDHTQMAIQAQVEGLSPDLVSIDLREAVDALGEITGETATEDLLDTIFSKFCIGK
ncbi:MAG TPA: tRNA uridine-5-carboxymethylaminomethyl(34) synthesis GTPase MnmE [Chloroflexi bacterium]|nr:tRNA uridine-5-carboxymethylaminomethyl(34) synthesis GTPase MnmE [Chloroflexota bacterium]